MLRVLHVLWWFFAATLIVHVGGASQIANAARQGLMCGRIAVVLLRHKGLSVDHVCRSVSAVAVNTDRRQPYCFVLHGSCRAMHQLYITSYMCTSCLVLLAAACIMISEQDFWVPGAVDAP
jgi:hypothetical protein